MNLIKIWPKSPPYFNKDYKIVIKKSDSQKVRLRWKQSKINWILNEPRNTLSSLFRFFYFFQTKNCQRTYKEIIAFLPFFPSLRNSKKMLYILFTTMQTKCTDFVLPRNKPKSVVKFTNCHIDQPRPGYVKFHLWFSHFLLKRFNLCFKWWGYKKELELMVQIRCKNQKVSIAVDTCFTKRFFMLFWKN